MYRVWQVSLVGLLAAVLALLPAAAAAQEQGLAVITSPLDGATVSGVVPITGSASHAQFLRYELAFAYSPNLTDTWFAIQAPQPAPIVNDVLGRWDTRTISDGLYVLRLRVYWAEDAFLEAFVQNVRVQNATPTAPASPTVPPATDTPSAAGTPTATPAILLPPTSTPRPTAAAVQSNDGVSPPGQPPRLDAALIGTAFVSGVRLTLVSFLILATYVSVKAAWRARPRR